MGLTGLPSGLQTQRTDAALWLRNTICNYDAFSSPAVKCCLINCSRKDLPLPTLQATREPQTDTEFPPMESQPPSVKSPGDKRV